MGRIANGATLSVRNLPSPVVQPDREKEPPPFYMEWLTTRLLRAINGIARYQADLGRRVEEYAGESDTALTGESTLTVIPDYEPAPEVITEILVTGPPSTAFVLQLGDRYMTLSTDAQGKCLLSPVMLILKATSRRILTGQPAASILGQPDGQSHLNVNGAIAAAVGANVQIPNALSLVTGFDISLSTVGTAAMTVTLSNVLGGPFTYTIPTGVQSLSIRYPIPLTATGGNPTLTWSATAAAVGNVGLFGEGFLSTPAQPGASDWFLHLSGYALTRNEAGGPL